ncbi:flavin-containing monooxygenase [Ponticaulis profundi]|uniref:Flavin-containing monooxygenase n=1 Tax=Ponticaulis profundi TaxID=2665222 RepID=A0ABW1S8G7_9PROT
MPADGLATRVDKEALKRKYAEERAKRLRPDGNAQYIELKDQWASYLEDPHLPVQPRDPKTDHVTFAFVGGGFAGLVTGARLKEAGITDYRIIEKGGDFGGTWYWNRYPGAQCDTASMIYMPLLEETGHMPTEKYAHGPEILEHCRRIGRQYELYDNTLFHTEVESLVWDDAASVWVISTNRGDRFTAQYVGLGTGPLHVPKLPGIPGIDRFQGKSFHTSRWDWSYTGGDDQGAPMDGLKDKRVAIIGTGATAVQIVPHLAKAAGTLYVCQRTPSSIDVRNNEPIDPDWFEGIATPGWQKRWLESFTANQTMGEEVEDLVKDGWTELSRRIRAKVSELPRDQMTPENMMAAYEDSDFEKMEEIRQRVDTIVADQDTAQKLKAWYRQLCKRPCFHDAYLQAFNEPGTVLLDTDGQGVEEITETGIVVAGQHYEVDCIVYASGFEVGTPFERRNGFDPVGRNGVSLSEYWADGMRTLHGLNVHGFPNAFLVQASQAANFISNYPHNLTEAGTTIATILTEAEKQRAKVIEADKAAEDAWVGIIAKNAGMMIGGPDCTPGYYNNEGQPMDERARLAAGYPSGPVAFFKYIDKWRTAGDFKGLNFTS